MWCSTCKQDVPAIAHPASGRSQCPRCNTVLRSPQVVKLCDGGIELDDEPSISPVREAPPIVADDWRQQRRTRELGRKLRIELGTSRVRSTPVLDQLEQLTAAPIVAPASYAERRVNLMRPESGQYIAWLVTLAGIVALSAGVGGMGWIIGHNGIEWWNHALALTLAGQGLLILGLVLVVTRLWRNSRYASGMLQAVHADLAQLQRSADALTAMRGGAPAFYGELVRGASSHTLLANLKGQIDQLATRLNSGL